MPPQFFRPLFPKASRHEHQNARHHGTCAQFGYHKACLHGFSKSNRVSDEYASDAVPPHGQCGIELKGQESNL